MDERQPLTKDEPAVEADAGSWKDGYASLVMRRRLMMGVAIGLLSGMVSSAYYVFFESAVKLYWRGLWPLIVGKLPASVLVVVSCGLLGWGVGVAMQLMGEPTANLPGLVAHFHANRGFLSCSVFRTVRVAIVSTLSICGAGSLGPEAPLVSMGGGVASAYWARFGDPDDMLVATICGMASGLAAFFGEPVGGAIFALEVLHRHGLEYFEALLPAIASGVCCNLTYRFLCGLPQAAIWHFADEPTDIFAWTCLVYGVPAGMVGGLLGIAWLRGIAKVRSMIGFLKGPTRTCVGGLVIGLLGCMAPGLLFWGEYEIQSMIDGTTPLKWAPPEVAALDFFGGSHLEDPFIKIRTGILKLVAILVTVVVGYRGGFIFPFMHAGISIGTGLAMLFKLPRLAHVALGLGAAINTAATRCVFATPVIMATLSGRADAFTTLFVSSLVSLVITSNDAVILAAKSRPSAVVADVKESGATDDHRVDGTTATYFGNAANYFYEAAARL